MLEHHTDSFISILMKPAYIACNQESGMWRYIW